VAALEDVVVLNVMEALEAVAVLEAKAVLNA
jgi:hypothetical protein